MLTRPPRTILVVDDEKMVRQVTARLLQELGYLTFEAGNASEALAACDDHAGRLDLALVDVMMHGGDGCTLGRRINQNWPELRVLLYSGYVLDWLVEQRICSLDMPFLRKPFSPQQLHEAVERALIEPPYRFPDPPAA